MAVPLPLADVASVAALLAHADAAFRHAFVAGIDNAVAPEAQSAAVDMFRSIASRFGHLLAHGRFSTVFSSRNPSPTILYTLLPALTPDVLAEAQEISLLQTLVALADYLATPPAPAGPVVAPTAAGACLETIRALLAACGPRVLNLNSRRVQLASSSQSSPISLP